MKHLLLTLLTLMTLGAMPLAAGAAEADETLSFEQGSVVLHDSACKNEVILFLGASMALDMGEMKAAEVTFKKGTLDADKEVTLAACYRQYDTASILLLDEMGDSGLLPRGQKL